MTHSSSRRIAVIMAGGSGERFWPLSRIDRPKQLLKLGNSKYTLFEQTVLNISPLIPPEWIVVATGGTTAEAILNDESGILQENIFIEPEKRNTAGCLIYAVANLLARYGGDGSGITMAALPADHNIGNGDKFRHLAEAAFLTAEQEDALVTLCITPSRPETGYGYLELDERPMQDMSPDIPVPVFAVNHFREKPDRKKAEQYIGTGRHFWNSGMFFWRLSTFIDELSHNSPEMEQALKRITESLMRNDFDAARAAFHDIESISIDYALMEKARKVVAIKADIGWDDVGSWDALDRTFPKDSQGNVTVGDPVLVNTKNCIVYNEAGPEKIIVAIEGVEGLAVITTVDGILIIPKNHAQNVRKVVEELKKRSKEKL